VTILCLSGVMVTSVSPKHFFNIVNKPVNIFREIGLIFDSIPPSELQI
jgi:hypothetical protein